MIYAVKHNKVNRGLYKANEDALTASIFERLRYLPKELMHHILQEALIDSIPDLDLKQLESIEFWSGWSADNTTNSTRVEPDLFIRTATHDLIIEAKRYDGKQQLRGQWEKEIQAWHNEYGEEEKPKKLLFIALGGLHTSETEEVHLNGEIIKIYKCTWSAILQEVKEIRNELERAKGYSHQNESICYILDDLILCFALFGFSTADWFEHFIPFPRINPSSLTFFNQPWKN